MCLNGGKLHLCDHCPRAVCHQCLPPPHDLDISKLDFVCLACHEVAFKTEPRQPYYVSCQVTLLRCLPLYVHVCTWQGYYVSSKQGTNTHRVTPGRLKPAILQPLVVQGQFQMTSRSQVSSDSLLILHLFWRILRPLALPHACYTNTSGPSLHTMMWPLKRSCSTWGTLSGAPHMSM